MTYGLNLELGVILLATKKYKFRPSDYKIDHRFVCLFIFFFFMEAIDAKSSLKAARQIAD